MIVNVFIYIHVRSSTRRIRPLPENNRNNTIQQRSRDIYLLKHMLFIFIVFIVGWSPTLIASLPGLSEVANMWIFFIVRTLPVVSGTIIGLDLFFYNRELRRYLKQKLLQLKHNYFFCF